MQVNKIDIFRIYLEIINHTQKSGQIIQQTESNNNIAILFRDWQNFTDSSQDLIFEVEEILQEKNLIEGITTFHNPNEDTVIIIITL